ncbi:MAG TPA: HGxxPAAW family protein [Jiangellaceae bacterium]|nr:HGxxPAAW family protein [Jiangellaceae bacterium]
MAPRHDHGHTPAAWTAVLIILAGIFIGAFAVAVLNWPLFWIGGVGVIVLGLIVGKVMQMMGLGKPSDDESSAQGVAATAPEGDR